MLIFEKKTKKKLQHFSLRGVSLMNCRINIYRSALTPRKFTLPWKISCSPANITPRSLLSYPRCDRVCWSNFLVSDVFSGYRKRPVARNELKASISKAINNYKKSQSEKVTYYQQLIRNTFTYGVTRGIYVGIVITKYKQGNISRRENKNLSKVIVNVLAMVKIATS